MVFSSLLFVFLFLPLNLIFYRLTPSTRGKNIVMLIFSLIFYTFGEPLYVFLLVGITFADWLIALYIGKQELRSKKAKFGIFLMCVINIGALGFFKYTGFILENIQGFIGGIKTIPSIVLPIGISFYSFQLISYVVDVYRKEVKPQKNFFTLLLYVSLFHQCIAGPIVRYKDIKEELADRRVSAVDLSEGIRRFVIGLAKKSILANACSAAANALLIGEGGSSGIEALATRPAASLWLGMIAYTLFIYLDFSAYSDMAIGMGKMIGLHYLENFNYPYIAESVTDFWRRWHISLSLFFRDYVYIPLGGNRKGKFRTVFNLLIVWALTGLWHGASWNFVLWGIYYFIFAVLERLFLKKLIAKLPKVFRHIYLLLIVLFGWVLFRFTSMDELLVVVKGMFTGNGNGFWSFETGAVLTSYIVVIICSIIAVMPLFKRLGKAFQSVAVSNGFMYVLFTVCRILIPVILLLLSAAALVGNSYNPFLYFRF